MREKLQHLGVEYSVRPLASGRWRWEVTPPKSVLGLRDQQGEIDGDVHAAMRAARTAIEWQTGRQLH